MSDRVRLLIWDFDGTLAHRRGETGWSLLLEEVLDAEAPGRTVDAAAAAFGHVDVLVANHARSGHQNLEQLTAAEIDAHLAVNARATMLLVQAFAAQHDDARPGGRAARDHREPRADLVTLT